MKVIAAIPIRNEEHILEHFFNHLFSFIDDAVVVDDGSTDATAQIIKKYQPKNIKLVHSNPIGTQPFCNGKESNNRNKLLQMARQVANGEEAWILQIDSDEFLTYQFKEELPKLLQKGCSTKIEILHLWDVENNEARFRVDSEWGNFYRYRLYKLLPRTRFSDQAIIATPKAFDRKNKYKCENVKIIHYGWCGASRRAHLSRYYKVYQIQHAESKITLDEFCNNLELQAELKIVSQNLETIQLKTWQQMFNNTIDQQRYVDVYKSLKTYWDRKQ